MALCRGRHSGAPARLNRAIGIGILLAYPAWAAIDEWTSQGPPGGTVLALAVDPSGPATVYVGIERGGVWKSSDGGATWIESNAGLVDLNIEALAVDPVDPQVLYVGSRDGELSKSIDGGKSWSRLGVPYDIPWIDLCYRVLLVSADRPSTLYAGAWSAIFKTEDGGETWTSLNLGVGVAPRHLDLEHLAMSGPETLYAGTGRYGLRKSTDGGESWFGANPPGWAKSKERVMGLAVSQAAPGTLYVSYRSFGVWKSTDGGDSWTAIGSGLPDPQLAFPNGALAIDPTRPDTVFITNSGGVWRSDDGAAQWSFFSSGLANSTIGKLVYDPRPPATLWAATVAVGPWKKAGESDWQPLAAGPDQAWVADLVIDPQKREILYAGTNGGGVWKSIDAARTWSRASTGLTDYSVRALTIDQDGAIFAGTGSSGVFRATVGEDSWERVSLDPDDPQRIDFLAADPFREDVIYAATRGVWPGPGLSKSVDGGESWQPLRGATNVVAFHPEDPSTIYAGDDSSVWESVDEGATWTELVDLVGCNVLDLAVDPVAPGRILAPTEACGVLGTIDGGATWEQLTINAVKLQDIEFDPLTPSRIYGVGGFGFRLSSDGGRRWQRLGNAPEELSQGTVGTVTSLAVDPVNPAKLYAGTVGFGAFDINLSQRSVRLNRQRFLVEASWRDFKGRTGHANGVNLTGETAGFWFFDSSNVELAVKVLDGRPSNGHFWIFLASLSNVEFTLTVTDTESGKVWEYFNPAGRFASMGDPMALPATIGSGPEFGRHHSDAAPAPPLASAPPSVCAQSSSALCLLDSRFEVVVRWRDFAGNSGTGTAVSLAGKSGYFWFFRPDNVELFLKVLDGRNVNGHFWVFFGALSNVEYTITVTDTETGEVRSYDNPPGRFASVGDTSAF